MKFQMSIPRAAVFNVPNGRFRSEAGSYTSISPSRMILESDKLNIGYNIDMMMASILFDPLIERSGNEWSQTSCSNVTSVEVGVVFAFPISLER